VQAVAPDLVAPPNIEVPPGPLSTEQFGALTQQWILLLKEPLLIGNLAFVALIPAVLALSRMKPGPWKLAVMVPVLYLLAFVWEARLTAEPAVTRLLLVGGLLVIMMIFRPNGLLGQRKIEIV
jgi:hypothetical protein